MNFLCAPVVWQVPCRGVRGVAVWALTQGHRTRTAPGASCLERRWLHTPRTCEGCGKGVELELLQSERIFWKEEQHEGHKGHCGDITTGTEPQN